MAEPATDLLAPRTPAQIEARERRLWDRAVCAQMRILLDQLAYAHAMAAERQDPATEALAARLRIGIADERALVVRNGGPDRDYQPGLKTARRGADHGERGA